MTGDIDACNINISLFLLYNTFLKAETMITSLILLKKFIVEVKVVIYYSHIVVFLSVKP